MIMSTLFTKMPLIDSFFKFRHYVYNVLVGAEMESTITASRF